MPCFLRTGFLGQIQYRLDLLTNPGKSLFLFNSRSDLVKMSKAPSKAFEQILELFERLNLLDRELSIDLTGGSYKVRCDKNCFMVYRIHRNVGPRSHVPGWPVCLVNHDTIFEECSSTQGSDDCFNCGISLDNWMGIIESTFRRQAETNEAGSAR